MKTRARSAILAFLPLLPFAAACSTTADSGSLDAVEAAPADPICSEEALEVFDAAWGAIDETHFDPEFNGVDWEAVRAELRPQAEVAATHTELRAILSDMVGRLGQSHFSIIPAQALPKKEESDEGAPDWSGSPGIDLRKREGVLLVSSVDPDSSAQRAGVKPGWILLDARPVDTPADEGIAEAGRSAALKRVYGAVGTEVELTFLDSEDREVTHVLEREALGVVPHDFGSGLPTFYLRFRDDTVEHSGSRIGVIHFTNWFLPMMKPIDEAVDRMRSYDGIVIDLRGNSGGAGPMTMGIAGHFFEDRRELGTQQMRDSTLKFVAMPRLVNAQAEPVTPFGGPLAILVDETSASASEVFSGGVQSCGRARVFGETSAGAVLPARTTMLPNGDALVHALGDFKTSTGTLLEGRGVVPDETVVLTREDLLAGRDRQLEAALDWIAAQPQP